MGALAGGQLSPTTVRVSASLLETKRLSPGKPQLGQCKYFSIQTVNDCILNQNALHDCLLCSTRRPLKFSCKQARSYGHALAISFGLSAAVEFCRQMQREVLQLSERVPPCSLILLPNCKQKSWEERAGLWPGTERGETCCFQRSPLIPSL